jgi:hypothetical protein
MFDTPPAGTMRSKKRGRIKPTPNHALKNLKSKSNQLADENIELRDRLAQLEAVVAGLASKKKGK